MNDSTARILLEEDRYPNGANSPTRHIEYACPCGKGRIIDERVIGFGDYTARLECANCQKDYRIVTGCGHIWELRKKSLPF